MTDKTYPKPFLSDDSDGGLRITNLVVENDKLSFDINITTTGVESEQETSSFKIYLESKTLIIHSNELIKDIVVTDLSGKGVMKWDNVTQPISLQQLSSGVYIVSVTLANDTTYQQKIILK
nr:T9SS type A sorting domain-containing protein [Bacteroides intestinalis]